MDWKNEYRNNKGKLFAIGAGALVLALIAFSGLCWCALGVCSEYIAGVRFSYWEILGISSTSFVGLLLIRPLGKRWLATGSSIGSSSPMSSPAAVAAPVVPAADHPEPDLTRSAESSGGWRDLYDKLSQEERRAFKALMEKYCADDPADEGVVDSSS
jgi:hypothetical protein